MFPAASYASKSVRFVSVYVHGFGVSEYRLHPLHYGSDFRPIPTFEYDIGYHGLRNTELLCIGYAIQHFLRFEPD